MVEAGACPPTEKSQGIPTRRRTAVFPGVIAQAGEWKEPERSESEVVPGVAGETITFLGNDPLVVIQTFGHPPFLNGKPGSDAFPVHVRGESGADQRLVPADTAQLIPGDGADPQIWPDLRLRRTQWKSMAQANGCQNVQ